MKGFCGACGEKVSIKICENICENCGSELICGSDFCIDCGAQVPSEKIPNNVEPVRVYWYHIII